jgi:hypothetical protein
MAGVMYGPDGRMKAQPPEHWEEAVTTIMHLFSQAQLWRNTFAAHWEEVAELVLPTSRNTFYYGNFNWPGVKKTDRQVDASAMMALHRFGAILDSLLTPRNMTWHALSALDDDLKDNREVKLWFEQVTRILFKMRYSPIANFSAQNQNLYQSLGAFGTGSMFIDQAVDEAGNKTRAWRYKALPLGETFFFENHQGLIDTMIRWFRLTPLQAIKQFGVDALPDTVVAAADQTSQSPFNFLHVIMPRKDWDFRILGPRGKPFCSYYVSLEGRCVIEEGGYNVFPVAASRYEQTPGEVYGRSPAMMVLPAIKTLNAEKRMFLKQGHRAADPVLLTNDDGLVDPDLRPGALNKGGVNSDGKPLIQVLPTGQIQVSETMMEKEVSLINDAFLVTLFQILTETPGMTATEVVERTNEKGILLAPSVGRQQSEYLGPLVHRELALGLEMGLFPPMPQALQQRRGGYETVYTSPLSRAMRAQEMAGAQRTIESTLTIVNATQDPSVLDAFNFDVIVPEMAEIQGVPASWMASPQDIVRKRNTRAQAAARQEQIQAAPAAAALAKSGMLPNAAQGQAGQPPQQPGQPGGQ